MDDAPSNHRQPMPPVMAAVAATPVPIPVMVTVGAEV